MYTSSTPVQLVHVVCAYVLVIFIFFLQIVLCVRLVHTKNPGMAVIIPQHTQPQICTKTPDEDNAVKQTVQ